MRARSSTIIIKDGKILLMHRQKPGKEYYTIIGGGVKKNETPEMAAIRETKEETNLNAEIDFLLFDFDGIYDRHEYFFVVKNISGESRLGGPELQHNSEEDNFELAWVELGKLAETNLLPPEAKQKIIETFCK